MEAVKYFVFLSLGGPWPILWCLCKGHLCMWQQWLWLFLYCSGSLCCWMP